MSLVIRDVWKYILGYLNILILFIVYDYKLGGVFNKFRDKFKEVLMIVNYVWVFWGLYKYMIWFYFFLDGKFYIDNMYFRVVIVF